MFCDAFFNDLVRLKEIGFIVKTFPLVNIQCKPYWWLYNIQCPCFSEIFEII